MADPVVTKIEAAVKAEVPTIKAKVLAYVKAHATPTVVGTAAGFAAGKFSIIGLILKVL
jgi:hypothetical protein